MKYSAIFMSTLAFLFITNCSTIPEIKPYEANEAKDEAAAEEQLPYGQSISDSVFSDTTVASDDEGSDDVPTEFDDRIDSADEDNTETASEEPAPKKEVVAKKASKHHRTPSSIGKGKNGFYTFSANCVMKSEPNDTSADKGNVSAGKKLWLDAHDATWFKAYKKNETVYVPSSCVQ